MGIAPKQECGVPFQLVGLPKTCYHITYTNGNECLPKQIA